MTDKIRIDGGFDSVLNVNLTSGLLTRRLVTRLLLMAEGVGLKVEHKHDGGVISRYHLVTVTGEWRLIDAWWRTVQGVIAKLNE